MVLYIAVDHDPRVFSFGLWVFVHISINELMGYNPIYAQREKGKDLTQPYDKTLIPSEKKRKDTTQRRLTKNLKYTTIADRLRAVSWRTKVNPIGVFNTFDGILI